MELLNIDDIIQSREDGHEEYSDEILRLHIKELKETLAIIIGRELWFENDIFWTGDYRKIRTDDKIIQRIPLQSRMLFTGAIATSKRRAPAPEKNWTHC